MDSTSESTPLLTRSQAQPPYLGTVVERLRVQDIESLNKDDIIALCPTSPALDAAEETAFVLVILLQLRLEERAPPPKNLWDKWTQEQKTQLNVDRLDAETLSVWSQFVDNWCTDDALVSTIVMKRFHFDESHQRSVTLLDLLRNDPVPKRLLSHRLMDLTIHRLWTAGHRESILFDAPFFLRVLDSMERFSTPRVMHAVDIIMHLIYLVILIHFATYPPVVLTPVLPDLGVREILIIIYTWTSLLRPPVVLRIPNLLVFLSFVTCLPSFPLPGDFSYKTVLFGITLHLIQFHLPYPPSPIFLFNVHHTIPLSTFLWNGFKRAFLPVLLFSIPVAAVSAYLLSLSLRDTFLRGIELTPSVLPTPMETRMTFLAFSFVVLILFVTSLITSTLNFVSISIARSSPWDRYSPRVGYESHRLFVNAVSSYAVPRFFPAPFNLLPLVFVQIPSAISRLFGKTKRHSIFHTVERGLWTIFVLPISTLAAGIWLWGVF